MNLNFRLTLQSAKLIAYRHTVSFSSEAAVTIRG